MSEKLRVLVTGGAGLIGSHIVEMLAEGREGLACSEIIVLDDFVRGRRENLASAMRHGIVNVVEGDIRDRELLAKLSKGVDHVYHQAALRITHCAADPRLALDVLGVGTYNVVEAAHNAGVKKILAASSASIYGLAEDFPTTEKHHPYDNRTLYGALKSFEEGLLRSFADMYGTKYCAVRPFNVYGPRMDVYGAYTEVMIRWMERIERGEPPLIFGDGSQTMDFVYVDDVARMYLLAAKAPATDEVFNCGTCTETSLKELAQKMCNVMGRPGLAPEFGPERKVNPVPRRRADISKAEKLLGWKPTVGLDDGLTRLVTWWREETKRGTAPNTAQLAKKS